MAGRAELELEAVKDDVRALRDALEAARSEASASEQRLRVEHRAEVDQLTATIGALREEMNRQREELLAVAQRAETGFESERRELRQTIAELRHRLEAATGAGST